MFERSLRPGILLCAVLVLAGCAHSPPDNPRDPLQTVNRGIYRFNDTLDRYAIRPVAKGYTKITPDRVQLSVSNFVGNLKYPITIVNDFLQLKIVHGVRDVFRFVANSTVGIGGLFDPAAAFGLEERDEDFGQTLGYWGLGQGAYLMLPLLGPSTDRDFVGRVGDYFTDPLFYLNNKAVEYSLEALYLLNLRASLLPFDRNVRTAFDPYAFVRTTYLQHRLNEVYDGSPPASLRESPVPGDDEPDNGGVGDSGDNGNPGGADSNPAGSDGGG